MTDDAITIDGMTFIIDDWTLFFDDVFEGDKAYVFAEWYEGAYYALYVEYIGDEDGEDNGEFEFDWYGTVLAIDDASITVGSEWADYHRKGDDGDFSDTFIITDDTVIEGEPQVDDYVYLYAIYYEDGTLEALYIEVLDDDDDSSDIEFYDGTVTEVTSDTLTLEDYYYDSLVTVILTDTTEFDGVPMVGDVVSVMAEVGEDEALVALSVYVYADEPDYEVVQGFVTAIDATSISVDAEGDDSRDVVTFAIDEYTWVYDLPEVGDEVVVEGGDIDGVLTAFVIYLVEPEPYDFFEVVGELETISTTVFTIAGEVYLIDDETEIEGEPQVGDTVYAFGEVTEAGNVTYYLVSKEPDTSFEIEGKIKAFDGTSIQIKRKVISITEATEIVGTPTVGAKAFVEGQVVDGVMIADLIYVDEQEDDVMTFVQVLGAVTEIGENSIVVSNTTFTINDFTETLGTPAVGLNVWVFGMNMGSTVDAIFILVLDEVSTEGVVDSMTASDITVDGVRYSMTSRTKVDGNIAVGDTVYIGTSSSGARNGQEALLIREVSVVPTAVSVSATGTATTGLAYAAIAVAMLGLAVVTKLAIRKEQI